MYEMYEFQIHRLRLTVRTFTPQLLVCFLTLWVFGCSGGTGPAVVQPELARQTLMTALNAWKDGNSIDSLRTQSPEIVVQDMDWTAGKQLTDFALQGDGKSVGANLSIEVALVLADASGETSTQRVWFLVGTDPALTVFRDMFH